MSARRSSTWIAADHLAAATCNPGADDSKNALPLADLDWLDL